MVFLGKCYREPKLVNGVKNQFSYPPPSAFLRETGKKRGIWGRMKWFEEGWPSDGVI